MKKPIAFILTILLLAALAACQFPMSTQPVFTAPGGASPTANQVATIVAGTTTAGAQAEQPGEATATSPMVVTETLPSEEGKPTLESSPTSPPTQAEAPTNTPKGNKTPAPTKPSGGTAATPTYASVVFNPRDQYGPPTFTDSLNRSSLPNWADQEIGSLPDTKEIQITIKDNKFYVTGKQPGFSTWWFSWPELKDFYIEFVANSKECSGKDAYGLIFRGPPHQAGVSYGYVVALSCDGAYWVYRLDGVDPWRDKVLVDWKPSALINDGANQVNMLAVQMIGDTLTVFINGKSVAQVKDAEYSTGRYGFFVQANDTYYYTYQPLELYYWNLTKK